ncbi:hypothetical protein QEG98_10530 [Myxococcus sp. MxC21-1]|uniref:hypothetical protein n=1 Tax=Myxococcus sp. MxC21-1 TaxID=3041439 RepID=UPI00292E9C8C|nr:hypothetical protein [Myxococcus sp. MxC21-1]WNZ64071.1 hypothetical protein QEG98_10530 [Myxococcus sp. MxC21-1]
MSRRSFPLWLLPALAACQPPAPFEGPLTPSENPVLVGGGCLSPSWRTIQFGSPGDDVAVDVGLDADCHIFVAGTTVGVLEEESLTRGQFQDAFVASLDVTAQPRWLHQYGSEWDDTVKGLAVSPQGETYVVGSTPSAMPGAFNLGQGDAFAIKHEAGGALEWLVQRGSAQEDTGLGVALSRDGRHVFLAGGSMEKPDVSFDMRVEVLDARDGTGLETRRHGTDGHDRAEAVAVSADGSVVLVGATLGGFASPNAGSFDTVLAHLDPTLGLTWARQPATPDIDAGLKVVIAPDGSILMLALSFSDLATGRAENDGISSAFLLKYDPLGRLHWVQRIGSPGSSTARLGSRWTDTAPSTSPEGRTAPWTVPTRRPGRLRREVRRPRHAPVGATAGHSGHGRGPCRRAHPRGGCRHRWLHHGPSRRSPCRRPGRLRRPLQQPRAAVINQGAVSCTEELEGGRARFRSCSSQCSP